jgi:hypothetical protein
VGEARRGPVKTTVRESGVRWRSHHVAARRAAGGFQGGVAPLASYYSTQSAIADLNAAGQQASEEGAMQLVEQLREELRTKTYRPLDP